MVQSVTAAGSRDAKGMQVERLLSTEEVAEVLGRPARTLRQWRYLGEGPRYLKVGATVRYRARDIEEWLRAQEQGPAARAQ
jgi:predicted DNA-binding transcriptional regulator AlpA